MLLRLTVFLLTGIALTGWGENSAQRTAFIFIEERPPFTSEDITAKSKAIYVEDRGLVQRYACEDDKLKAMQESVLPVAELFKTLSGLSLTSLPSKPDPADAMPPLSQAHPGHMRIRVRQQDGAEYQWAGIPAAVPSVLQKLVQEATALAERSAPTGSAAGTFVRADILNAEQLDEYRAIKTLKSVKNLNELDPVLQKALVQPCRLIPVPAGANPFSGFTVKGELNQLPLVFNATGFEVHRYSITPLSRPDDHRGESP